MSMMPKGMGRLPMPKSVSVTVSHEDAADDGDGNDKEDMADKKYDEWDLKNHADTLAKAEEIKADPHLMKALKPHLEKKAKAYKSLSQLRHKASMMPKAPRV